MSKLNQPSSIVYLPAPFPGWDNSYVTKTVDDFYRPDTSNNFPSRAVNNNDNAQNFQTGYQENFINLLEPRETALEVYDLLYGYYEGQPFVDDNDMRII